jgi:sulfur carrier protein ThiS
MQLHLGGHFNWYDPQKRAWLAIPLAAPVSLRTLLEQLHVPPAEVAILTVNGRLARLEGAVVSDGDRVEVYPAIGGG